MWFNARQDFIHAGWMQKMGGGTSTLGRKNWKRRWMTLKGGELHYHPSQEEDATVLGIVDIQSSTEIVEVCRYLSSPAAFLIFIPVQCWSRERLPNRYTRPHVSYVDRYTGGAC